MRLRHFLQPSITLCLVAMATLIAGCQSIGPKTMNRDQLNYGQSVGDNWKNQMLANIVKIRYADMPVFMDVGSIVSGYSLETQVSATAGFNNSFTGGDSQGLGATGKFTDRPTITYMPKTGEDYLRSLLSPVEPKHLLALIQAGYNSELLFTWSVESVNGVKNYSTSASGQLKADPEFYEFTGLMLALQREGVVAWEFKTQPETKFDIMLVIRDSEVSESTIAKRQRIAEILGLDGGTNQYRVMYAPFRVNEETLALQTRSVIQMLASMSGFVEVPAELAGTAAPGFDTSALSSKPFHVNSGKSRPDSAYAAVKYHDHWYWIDDTDLASKRVFLLMLFITTLTNKGDQQMGPVLTIPTG